MEHPMTAEQAREYAPTWGSYVTASDPGYILYTAIPPKTAQQRDLMVAYIREVCLPMAVDEGPVEGDEFEYSDPEMLARLISYLEALPYE